jgi:hypothetical protein
MLLWLLLLCASADSAVSGVPAGMWPACCGCSAVIAAVLFIVAAVRVTPAAHRPALSASPHEQQRLAADP